MGKEIHEANALVVFNVPFFIEIVTDHGVIFLV